MHTQDQRLTVRQAAAHLGVSVGFLNRARIQGGGPVYIKLGQRRVVYDRGDLDAYLAAGRRLPTSRVSVSEVGHG